MTINDRLIDPSQTLDDAIAAKDELGQMRTTLQATHDTLGVKALRLVTNDPSVGTDELNAIVIEQRAIELRITGAQALLERADAKIEQLKAKAADDLLARQWNNAEAKLDYSDQELDAAEDCFMKGVERLKSAMQARNDAIALAPEKPGFHQTESIREGLLLIPAITQRLWLQLQFRHPNIETFDNHYAHQLGKISEIFSFERRQILNKGNQS